ncbi:MAG: GIY-YIG nuclease family protein [Acidobacteriaceae bacterium]
MPEYAYVYILSNSFRKLYIGITTNLELRVWQHKHKTHPKSHTARYSIDQLVYFERFTSLPAAIKREKVLKGWLRMRKLELIITTNPLWIDLSEDWGQPIVHHDLDIENNLTRPQQ